jgi:hypothetical protein
MIEPSSGRPITSGPGTPLLFGILATGALLVAFLIGFQLGSGEDRVRTIIVGASPGADAAAELSRTPSVEPGGLIQGPQVANELQQAYYANLHLGAWVVCAEGSTLSCVSAKHVQLDSERAFDPPATHWPAVPVATLTKGSRTYLVGNLEHVWIGAVEGREPQLYDRLLGVTLNGSVLFVDLGDLPAGDYVVLNRSENAFTDRGPVSLAIGLTIKPAA